MEASKQVYCPVIERAISDRYDTQLVWNGLGFGMFLFSSKWILTIVMFGDLVVHMKRFCFRSDVTPSRF